MNRHQIFAALAVPISALSVTLAPSVAHGQLTPPVGATAVSASRQLTLTEALRLALDNNPRLRAASGDRLMRIGQASERSAFSNPHVEWRREGTGTTGGVDDFLTVALPLDLTGRRFVARGAVSATRRSAEADSIAIARAVAFDAARAYHRSALATSLSAVAARQQGVMEDMARYDSTRWREGAAAEIVSLRASLEAGRSRAASIRAALDARRAQAELAIALGLPVDSVGIPMPIELDEAGALDDRALLTVDELAANALERRPEVQAAREAVRAAELAARVEQLGMLGDVTIGGGSRRSGGETGGTISVGMNIPLLNRNGAARQQASGELLAARAEQRRVELLVLAEVTAAAEEYQRLREGLTTTVADEARRGAEVAEIVQAAYREGGATLLELLDAQRAAAETAATVLGWMTDMEIARLDLLQASGAPLSEAMREERSR